MKTSFACCFFTAVLLIPTAPAQAALPLEDLLSQEPQVRQTAEQKVRQEGAKHLDTLIANLQAESQKTQVVSLRALVLLGPQAKPAAAPIAALASRTKPPMRWLALEALRDLGPASAGVQQTMLKLLDDDNFHTQYWACRVLGAIGSQAAKAAPALQKKAENGVASVRRNAIAALGDIGPAAGEDALQTLRTRLFDPRQLVKEAAAEALGKWGDAAKPALPDLRKAARQHRAAARVVVCRALWRLTGKAEEVTAILVEEVQKNHAPFLALEVLSEIGPLAGAAGQPLQKLLDTPDQELKEAIQKTLLVLRKDKASTPSPKPEWH